MRIIFMGTPDFAVPSLRRLLEHQYNVVAVVTQPDRPKGRKQILTPSPVKEVALEYGIPVLQPERIRKPEEYNKILALQPDLIVTAAFGQIIPKAILDAPRYGCINVHASLLPKYRGGAPIHYAVMNGETETGVTIMYMVEELDAGDILSQVTIPVHKNDTAGTIFEKLSVLGADLLIETIPKIVEGKITPIKQDHNLVTYSPTLKRQDEWLDFSRPAESLYNQIRGLNPWPVAFTMMEDHVIKVWWAEWKDEDTDQPPGTITRITPEGIEIATGKGILIIKELQPAGKKRMHVSDYVRGSHWLKEGMRFDETFK